MQTLHFNNMAYQNYFFNKETFWLYKSNTVGLSVIWLGGYCVTKCGISWYLFSFFINSLYPLKIWIQKMSLKSRHIMISVPCQVCEISSSVKVQRFIHEENMIWHKIGFCIKWYQQRGLRFIAFVGIKRIQIMWQK